MSKKNTILTQAILFAFIIALIALAIFNRTDIKKTKSEHNRFFQETITTIDSYEIKVYYFEDQKAAALGLQHYFKQQGYPVKLLSAENITELQYKRNTASHIFFKEKEFDRAMQVKQKVEQIIGQPVNAYRFINSPDNTSMMVVFSSKK